MLKLYLKNFKRKKTCKEFLVDLIVNYFPETYYDKECKQLQCDRNRRRSITDLIFISKTYYTSLTKSKIMFLITSILLDKTVLGNLRINYFLSFCSTVRKFVICSYSSGSRTFDSCTFNSYYNNSYPLRYVETLENLFTVDNLSIKQIFENYKKYLNDTPRT